MERLEDYTVEQLRARCRSLGLRGYGSMTKAQLFEYCVEGKSLEEAKRDKIRASPAPRAVAAATSPPVKSPVVDKFDVCLSSEAEALRCVRDLERKYPEMIKKICVPAVPGPAAALIVEGGDVVAIATSKGEIRAVEGRVPAPPPPPRGPPPLIPRVQLPPGTTAARALAADIRQSAESKPTVSALALSQQLSKLKKAEAVEKVPVPEAEIVGVRKGLKAVEMVPTPRRQEGGLVGLLSSAMSQRRSVISGASMDEDESGEEWDTSPKSRPARPVPPPRSSATEEVRPVPPVRSPTVEKVRPEPPARSPPVIKKTLEAPVRRSAPGASPPPITAELVSRECDYNMIYDPRLGRCVPVEPTVTRSELERAVDIAFASPTPHQDEGCRIS